MLDAVDLIITAFAPIVAQLIVDETTKKAYGELKKLIKDRLKGRPEADLVDKDQKPEDWEEKLKKALTEALVDRDMEIIKQAQNLMAQVFPDQAQRGEYNTRITRDLQNPVILILQDGKQHTAPFLSPPRPPHDLFGRESLLKDLKTQLLSGSSVVLSGLPGVGKTTIAVELAHDPELLAHFKDGVLWTSLGRKKDASSHLEEWGAILGIPTSKMESMSSIEARKRAIQNKIGMRRILLVIDDVWDIETAWTFWVDTPNCVHVVTTRLPEVSLNFADKMVTEVPELKEPDGLELLGQFVSALVHNKQESHNLFQAVGGLPLALIAIGRYLKKQTHLGQSLQEAVDQLYETKEWLRQKQILPERMLSLQAIIEISDRALDDASRSALRALSIFPPKPNSFSKEAACKVASQHVSVLYKLAGYGLLESGDTGRYVMHQTVADYAQADFTDKTVNKRMAEFFVSYVESCRTDYRTLEIETNNILAALQIAADQNMKKTFIQGVNAFYHFMEARGLYDTAEQYLKQAYQDSTSLNYSVGLATTLLHLGRLKEKRKDNTQAEECYREGLKLAKKVGDPRLISDLLRNLGVFLSKCNDLEEAKKCYREGLDLAERINDHMLISDHHQGLGIIENKRNHFEQAKEHLERALDLARENGYHTRAAAVFASMVVLENRRKKYEKAEEYFKKGYDLASKIGDRRRISSLLVTMGFLELSRNNYKQAEKYSLEGMKIVLEMGYYERVDTFLRILDSAHTRGNFKEKEKYSLEGVEPSQMIRDYDEISMLIENLGVLERDRQNFQQAEKYLQKGLELAHKIENPERISSLLRNMGVLERDRQNFQQAEKYLQKGLDLVREIDNCWLTCGILNDCGECYLKLNELDSASKAFFESLKMAQKMGLQESTAFALYGLARIAAVQKNMAEAHKKGQESLTVFENMAHKKTDEVKQWLASLP